MCVCVTMVIAVVVRAAVVVAAMVDRLTEKKDKLRGNKEFINSQKPAQIRKKKGRKRYKGIRENKTKKF